MHSVANPDRSQLDQNTVGSPAPLLAYCLRNNLSVVQNLFKMIPHISLLWTEPAMPERQSASTTVLAWSVCRPVYECGLSHRQLAALVDN